MSKRSNFVCQQCGYSQVGWAGKCPNCGTWGSLVETIVSTNSKSQARNSKQIPNIKPQKLIDIKTSKISRIITKISELDRVLGGGFVAGQVALIAGEPGIGKSTLLLQVADALASVLYVSGEESATQVKLRAQRLKIANPGIAFLDQTDVDVIIATLESLSTPPSLVIIDSIQTMATEDLSGMAGSVGQVRECASRLLQWAKRTNTPLIMVGHVTKQGSVAGPAVLAHIVDTVLWFEGDKSLTVRMLRAVKNRFGPTDEIGIFYMQEVGLVPLTDEGAAFLEHGKLNIPGTAIASIMEGSRPLLVEIQTLVVTSKLPYPKRVVQGIDPKRVELLIAVLARRCGVPVLESDIYVNAAGGISIREPGADLAISLAIASAYFDKPLPPKTLCVGEVGLLGEIRQVNRQDQRIKEGKRLGYTRILSNKMYPLLKDATRSIFR
jgi:DNA repair protein RadA/Sms